MLHFIHAIVGVLIGTSFSSAWLIALLAIVSHFLLDIIPHRDSLFTKKDFAEFDGKIPNNKKAIMLEVIDSILGILVIVYFYIMLKNPLIILGAFFSLFPDMIKLLYLTPIRNSSIFKGYVNFHTNIQKEIGYFFGILTQMIIFILAYLAIVF